MIYDIVRINTIKRSRKVVSTVSGISLALEQLKAFRASAKHDYYDFYIENRR